MTEFKPLATHPPCAQWFIRLKKANTVFKVGEWLAIFSLNLEYEQSKGHKTFENYHIVIIGMIHGIVSRRKKRGKLESSGKRELGGGFRRLIRGHSNLVKDAYSGSMCKIWHNRTVSNTYYRTGIFTRY